MPDYVSLPNRNGICKTCGGRIHHYPPPATAPTANAWAHVDPADWRDNPHLAEPKDAA